MKINTLFFKIGLVILLFSQLGFAVAQEEEVVEEEVVDEEVIDSDIEKQIISLTDLAVLMRADERETVISDYEIVSSENDNEFLVDKVFFSLYKIYPDEAPAKKIYFYNCKFDLKDGSPLVFKNWRLGKLNIVGCEFVSPISFDGFQQFGTNPFLVENCVFHAPITFESDYFEAKDLILRNNTFKSSLLVDFKLDNLVLENCDFVIDNSVSVSKDEESSWYQFTIGEHRIENFKMVSCKFSNSGLSNVFSVDLASVSLGSVLLQSNYLQSINLTSAEIEKSLLIDSLFVDDYIGILNFDFPEKNTNASWNNLSGEKLAIFEKEKSGFVTSYQAKTNKQLADNLRFNDLMSAYNKFNTLYHDRGDIISANASYVEIKDIETRKQAFEQTVNPSRNNLINYKLNVFLRFFSDYATNPGKSLEYSIYMILLFAFMYMFTFSRWDGMNYSYYLSQLNRFTEYVADDLPIEDVFKKKKDPIAKEIKLLKKKYIELGKDMPRILKLFGGPLHFLGKFRYDVLPGLIRFFNFQPEKWKNITGFKRVWAGFLIMLIVILFSVYVLVVRFFNSLIMSLNSFVVIGFGSLPEEDSTIAMYLSIIEGIIGWFLLTIFTITLLSQVLQSA